MVVLEAMRSFVAVAATSVVGLPEVLGPCRSLVGPDDEATLAERVAELVVNAAMNRAWRVALRRRFPARYGIGKTVDGILDVYDETAANQLLPESVSREPLLDALLRPPSRERRRLRPQRLFRSVLASREAREDRLPSLPLAVVRLFRRRGSTVAGGHGEDNRQRARRANDGLQDHLDDAQSLSARASERDPRVAVPIRVRPERRSRLRALSCCARRFVASLSTTAKRPRRPDRSLTVV